MPLKRRNPESAAKPIETPQSQGNPATSLFIAGLKKTVGCLPDNQIFSSV